MDQIQHGRYQNEIQFDDERWPTKVELCAGGEGVTERDREPFPNGRKTGAHRNGIGNEAHDRNQMIVGGLVVLRKDTPEGVEQLPMSRFNFMGPGLIHAVSLERKVNTRRK